MTLLAHKLLPLLLFVASLCFALSAAAKPARHGKNTQRGARRVAKPNSKSASDAFCKAFNAQCFDSAVQGKQGEVQVVHVCRRNGKKYSRSYTFGCKSDGVDITQQVLNQIGNGYTVTSTAGSTLVVSQTATAPTSTMTAPTSTVTSVTTSYTSTEIQTATFGGDPVPIVVINIPSTTAGRKRKRADVVDASSFCSAFSTGCSSECARVSSTPKHTVCQAGQQTASGVQYKLACYCKNRKVETQHALKDAVGQQHVTTVSTVATSTSFYTTATPVTTLSPTTTTTTTKYVASTTQIVLAATGKVAAVEIDNAATLGYLKYDTTQLSYEIFSNDAASADSFMAVRDPASPATLPLYQLQRTDGSGTVLIAEVGSGGTGGAMRPNTDDYLNFEQDLPSYCGTSGQQAGQPAGNGPQNGNGCETYVFGPRADGRTPQSSSLNLTMQWVQPGDGTTPTQLYMFYYTGYTPTTLEASVDAATYLSSYSSFGSDTQIIELRFPA